MKVLLTGATGFLGKIILEEMLRKNVALGIQKIFLVIRNKKNILASERFKKIWESVCFANINQEQKNLVEIISGDTEKENLDLEDVDRVCREVTHIIGCAANTNFNADLKQIAQNNVSSVLHLVDLAKKCLHLKVYSHISTAYVNLPSNEICKEELVSLPKDAIELYEDIVNDRASFDQIDHNYPNTYALTKCIAEHILVKNTKNCSFKVNILRPSIIANSYQYPHPGWTDSYTAYMGYLFLLGSGLLKGAITDKKAKANIIPVDVTAQEIINHTLQSKNESSLQIKNVVIPPNLQISYGDLENIIFSYFRKNKLYRHPMNLYSKKGIWYWFLHSVVEKFPLWMAYKHQYHLGSKKKASKIKRGLRNLAFSHQAIHYYSHNTWNFETTTNISEENIIDYYNNVICQGCAEYLKKT